MDPFGQYDPWEVVRLREDNRELKEQVETLTARLKVANEKISVLQRQASDVFHNQQDYLSYADRDA